MDSTQPLKGVLDSAVLAVLDRGSTYGYDLVRQLRTGGFEEVGDASVYGTLRRLFGGGYLTSELVPSEEGPARKYYGSTGPELTCWRDPKRPGMTLPERWIGCWREKRNEHHSVAGEGGLSRPGRPWPCRPGP